MIVTRAREDINSPPIKLAPVLTSYLRRILVSDKVDVLQSGHIRGGVLSSGQVRRSVHFLHTRYRASTFVDKLFSLGLLIVIDNDLVRV